MPRELKTIFRSLRDFAAVSVPCDGLVISLYDHNKETRRAAYCWTDEREFDPKEVAEVAGKRRVDRSRNQVRNRIDSITASIVNWEREEHVVSVGRSPAIRCPTQRCRRR
jgi:hypothetical protein